MIQYPTRNTCIVPSELTCFLAPYALSHACLAPMVQALGGEACEAEASSPFDVPALHGAACKELIVRRSLLHARDRILLGVLVFPAVQQPDFPSWRP